MPSLMQINATQASRRAVEIKKKHAQVAIATARSLRANAVATFSAKAY
jgi:hypothetical protein